jgi:hypothetical protein
MRNCSKENVVQNDKESVDHHEANGILKQKQAAADNNQKKQPITGENTWAEDASATFDADATIRTAESSVFSSIIIHSIECESARIVEEDMMRLSERRGHNSRRGCSCAIKKAFNKKLECD